MNTLSDRVSYLEAEGAYAVLARAQELESQGREILHLEIGQPDYPTPEHVAAAGIKAIREGKTRYTPPVGLPRLRELIAGRASKRLSLDIKPDTVVVGPGSKPGLFFPTLALVQPGDEVIYPDPGFPTYEAMIRVAGGIPIPIPLREENQFSYDLQVFDDRISDKTKLVILNSPANPTGGVMPAEDLIHVTEKTQKHNCWVISDEIYTHLVYDGFTAPSIASLPGMLERTIIVDGFSKTYSMTGWRLGYMIMPKSLAERVELLLTHSVGCTATFTQYAGIEALEGPQDFVEEMVDDYQRRRDRIVSGLNSIKGVQCQIPRGAFYAFPNIKSFGLKSKELARRILDEAGVALLAGTDFGSGGEGYLRLCYSVSPDTINQGLEKLNQFFSKL